jgi:chloramphenicol 3-O-phosphotransferase
VVVEVDLAVVADRGKQLQVVKPVVAQVLEVVEQMVAAEAVRHPGLQEQQQPMVARVHLAHMDLAVEASLQTVDQIAMVGHQ